MFGEEICIHSISNGLKYNEQRDITKLSTILRSNNLFSLRSQNRTTKHNFCGLDYISLCDLSKVKKGDENKYCAYGCYGCKSLSFVFDKNDLEVIEPILIPSIYETEGGIKQMEKLGTSNLRYSDLFDEVQVKGKISLSLMKGIALPVRLMKDYYGIVNIDRQIRLIEDTLLSLNYIVPIYDIESYETLNTDSYTRRLK